MHVHVYMCKCSQTRIDIHDSYDAYVIMNVHVYIRICTCIYIYTYRYVCMYANIRIYVYMLTYVYTYWRGQEYVSASIHVYQYTCIFNIHGGVRTCLDFVTVHVYIHPDKGHIEYGCVGTHLACTCQSCSEYI